MYVLDTNTLIYFMKGMGNVPARLTGHPPSQIFIPTPVIFEICVGLEKSGNKKTHLTPTEPASGHQDHQTT